MTAANGGGDTEALRREIARTRAELGETVQALAAKADVKARAREQVEQTKQRVRERAARFTGTVKGQAGSVRRRRRWRGPHPGADRRAARRGRGAGDRADRDQGEEQQVSKTVNKVAYKPVGILMGIAAGALAGVVFKQVWKLAAGDGDAPNATDEDRGWGEILAAAALQGAIFAIVKAAVDRGGATGVRKLTGDWPT